MKKKIIRREIPEEYLTSLASLPPILGRIYAARQIQSMTELDREITQLLPFDSLLNINKAVHFIAEALKQNKKILIVGDFDADGATSTAVALRALKSFGAQVNYLVPNRFAFGYGLTPELVKLAAQDPGADLIITVDNGIANHAGVDAAKQLGIGVVITDHHLASTTLPDADAIVNPNQPGDLFGSKNLAGVGVIFYVMLALRRYLTDCHWFEQKNIPIPNMARLLDLVALGTIADLVPLDRNNRILVHQGLRRIRNLQCVPGIVALLEFASRDVANISAADLGFVVASRLNAAGRLDDMSLGIECLLADDSNQARFLARTLNELNHDRKAIEQGMQTQALAALDKLQINAKGEIPRGLCLFDDSWHQGVIGILASRIKDKFNRPVIVFAPGQNNELKGSARSISGFHIRDALALIDAQNPQLILKYGGHAMAAGLTIARHLFDHFAEIFNAVVAKQINDEQLQHFLLSDGELDQNDFNLEVATLLKEGGPWGQAFAEPIFDDTFRVLEQRIVGDKHLKLRIAKQDKVFDAVAFFIDLNVWPNHRCEYIHAAYRLDINEYKGKRNIQLIIEYLEPVTIPDLMPAEVGI